MNHLFSTINIIAVSILLLIIATATAAEAPFNFRFPRIGDQFGTNIHWTSETTPGEAKMLSKAFKIARMDLTWGAVERYPQCGKYDFSAYDILVSQLDAVGVRPYLILDYSNKCYAPHSQGCTSPRCIHGFGNFAAAVAQHWANRTDIFFEILNEPNGMGHDDPAAESSLIKAAWQHFSQNNQTVLGPTTSGIDFAYIEKCFNDGILNSLSAVSVHPYRSDEPETARIDYQLLRDTIDLYTDAGKGRKRLPIVGGEWGYTSALLPCNYGDRVNSPTMQGKYAVRMWLTDLLSGVVSGILYDWHDDGSDPTKCEENFGSVRFAKTGNASLPFDPKPAYLAALTFQRNVGNAASSLGQIPATLVVNSSSNAEKSLIEQSLFVAAFEMPGSGRRAFAVWHANPLAQNATYSLSFDAGSGSYCWNGVSTFGEESGQYCSDPATGKLIVTDVSDAPLYLM